MDSTITEAMNDHSYKSRMGATWGTGTAYPSESPYFTTGFSEIRVVLLLVVWVKF